MSNAKKSSSVVLIFGIIITLFFIFIGFAFYLINNATQLTGTGTGSSATSFMSQFSDTDESKGPIGVIEVDGVIMQSKKIIKLLHIAEKDKSLKAIILKINSPGGAVGPTQEIYEEIIRIDQNKPIYASFESIAASGGYYLGAACRKIYSNPGSITGSIGVIMHMNDLSAVYKWAKVKPEIIKAGKFKDAGSPHRSLKNEERMMMEQMLSVVHRQFLNDISKRRSAVLKEDLSILGQGQIFSGEEAYNLGLVDRLGGLWKAGREIHKELKIKEEFDLRYITKKKKFNLNMILQDLEDNAKSFIHSNLFGKTPLFL